MNPPIVHQAEPDYVRIVWFNSYLWSSLAGERAPAGKEINSLRRRLDFQSKNTSGALSRALEKRTQLDQTDSGLLARP